jgi:mono/diheme cytochrome c family protein
MPSRLVRLLAIACACLGLTVGFAACGGNDDDKSVELTELPAEPQNGSSVGRTGGGRLGTGSSSGGDAATEEGADGGDAAEGDSGDAAGGGAAGGATPVGQEIFKQSCAGCHTLADAGATGSVGPNLDDTRLDEAGIAAMVRSGGGGMPSFGGTLQPEQIDEVAAYVASASGS